MESIRNNQCPCPERKNSDDAITIMFKQTAIIKPYKGEAAEYIKAIDNTHKNDPHALVWNLPGWNYAQVDRD